MLMTLTVLLLILFPDIMHRYNELLLILPVDQIIIVRNFIKF